MNPLNFLVMLVRRDIKGLEYDPGIQYRFHFYATWFWALTMVAVPFVPRVYAHDVAVLVVQEISLWANFATHLGSMSSAIAATKDKEQPVAVTHELATFDLS